MSSPAIFALFSATLVACGAPPRPLAADAPPGPSGAPVASVAPPRVAAIGDLHGDLASAQAAFRLAGAVDAAGRWVGGSLVVVQVGDQTDRGDDEREILTWLETLSAEARAAGGAVHLLLGNHEILNAQLDFRYVTPGGFADFADTVCPLTDAACGAVPEAARGRVAAFRPGGPWARRLAEQAVALRLGDTIFVHGGLEPRHARAGLEALNGPVRAWLSGDGPEPSFIEAQDGPLWSRRFGGELDALGCEALGAALAAVGASRMVVGHTVQPGGITSACDGRVWRVDVGLSDHYGGPTEVLELVGATARVLRETGAR
jgi:hypothetical protein